MDSNMDKESLPIRKAEFYKVNGRRDNKFELLNNLFYFFITTTFLKILFITINIFLIIF